jgi:kumamolisin
MRDETATLSASRRSTPPGTRVGPADPDEVATVTVYLRRRSPSPQPGRLSRAAFAAAYGADPADAAAVGNLASARGLAVGAVDLARRSVQLVGTLGALADTFEAELATYRHASGATFRGREGELSVPRALVDRVAGVFGLDSRPQARAQFRVHAGTATGYAPPDVARAYGFPAGLTGAGECVALLELGGGFRTSDLDAYFAALGLATPSVEAVSVDGTTNAPGAPSGPDGEVLLDLEVTGSVAPGARLAVYFAPNTDQGFLDAVTTAVHDATRRPSVLSISWGQAEAAWTAQAMDQMEQAFVDAAAMGMVVTVASGDGGSADGLDDGRAHVDFPASAPHAIGCGGTSLRVSGATITSETAWNDGPGGGAGGGGVSDVFALPAYQASAGVGPSANPGHRVGRGVPDVAGDADPETGYEVRVDGASLVIGGTSAVAPLWAGLLACVNEGLGRPVGDLHDFLYAQPVGTVTGDVTTGDNGAYAARPGWDACTGLGSPRGEALLVALRAADATT